MGDPQSIRSQKLRRHDGGNTLASQDPCEGFRTLPRNPVECGFFDPTAYRRESGDQASLSSSPSRWLTLTGFDPSAFMTKISDSPSRVDTKAISVPSRDQVGCMARAHSSVSITGVDPSAFMTTI